LVGAQDRRTRGIRRVAGKQPRRHPNSRARGNSATRVTAFIVAAGRAFRNSWRDEKMPATSPHRMDWPVGTAEAGPQIPAQQQARQHGWQEKAAGSTSRNGGEIFLWRLPPICSRPILTDQRMSAGHADFAHGVTGTHHWEAARGSARRLFSEHRQHRGTSGWRTMSPFRQPDHRNVRHALQPSDVGKAGNAGSKSVWSGSPVSTMVERQPSRVSST
jgi:hypothetical protein